MLDGLSWLDPAYAAHEYLGGSFTPMMFADVAGELSGAKCAYVGSTILHEAIPSCGFTPISRRSSAPPRTSRCVRRSATSRTRRCFAATSTGEGWRS